LTESARLNLVCPKFNYNRRARSHYKSAGQRQKSMGKSNVAEKFVVVPEVIVEVSAPAVMTIVKEEPVEVRKLTLDEKIQKVEDLSLMIDRWRTLSDSRRKLQTFQIGADTLSSTILLKDGAGNEFRTSNSTVITSVIDEMKRTLDVKVREVEELINL
jgi:hypothetical protein